MQIQISIDNFENECKEYEDYLSKLYFKGEHKDVIIKKAKVKDEFTEVVCDFTYSDGTTKEKKFHLYKEDDIWKTEIGFKEMRDIVTK